MNTLSPPHRALGPLVTALLLTLGLGARAQSQNVGIGTTTPDSKAALEISATDKGLLIPRLTQAQRTAISSPPDGLMIFQTDGTTPGFWYYFGGQWNALPNTATAGDNLGNHTATQNLNLGINQLVGNGGTSGVAIDNAGNVGLGTTTPGAKLHVVGNSTLTGSLSIGTGTFSAPLAVVGSVSTIAGFQSGSTAGTRVSLGNTSTSGSTWYLNSTGSGSPDGAGKFVVSDAGSTTRLTVTSSGQVGVNTGSPAARLDIQGGADNNGANDPYALAFQWRNGGYRHWVRSRHNGTVTGSGNALDFYLNNASGSTGSSAPGTGNVQVMTIESNNGQPRVGIGTTAPAATLEVSGATSTVKLGGLAGTGNRLVTVDANGNLSSSSSLPSGVTGDNLGNHTATQNLNLGANQLVGNGGTTGLSLKSTGYLGLGTTNPAGQFHSVANTGADASDDYIFEDYRQGNTLTQGMVQRAANGTQSSPAALGDGTTTGISLGGYMFSPYISTGYADAGFLTAGMEGLYRGDGTTNATELHFRTSGARRLTIGATGNVGIGSVGTAGGRLAISPTSTEAKITLYDGGDAANHYGFGVSSNQLNYHVRGTAASHVFYGSGKNGDGTEVMRIQGTGNVGIGTASPTYRLQVVGGDTRIAAAGTQQALFGLDRLVGFDDLRFYGDNLGTTELMRLQSNGNLGIGTTSPNYRLQVVGGDTRIAAAGTQQSLFGVDRIVGFDDLRFYGDDLGATELMRLQSNGNLGMGTTSPTAKLDVNGSTRLRGLTTAGVVTTDANGNLNSATAASLDPTTASNGLTKAGNNFTLGGALTQATTLVTSGNNFNVTGTGNVGIGTTSPTEKLHVEAGNVFINGESTGLIVDSQGARRIGMMKYTGREAGIWRTIDPNNLFEIGRVQGVTSLPGTPTGYLTDIAVTNDGNVGIGTSTPATLLHVTGTAGTPNVRLGSLAGTGTRVVTTDAGGNLSATLPYPDGTTFIQNQFDSDQTANFQISGGGSLGAGLTVDNANSNDGTFTSSNAALRFGTAGTGEGIGSARVAGSPNLHGLDFYTGYANRLSIGNNGNVGIGTTAPSATLEVGGATSTVKLGGLAGTGTRVVTADATGNLSTVTTASLADNLGNHTATQNLNLGANYLSPDGTGKGIALGSSGQVGINTTTTNKELNIGSTDTPGISLIQSGGTFGAYTWDVAGNEANFFVRDRVTNRLPLRIKPGAPENSLYIAASGNVGMGTNSPSAPLHVNNTSQYVALLQSSNTAGTWLEMDNTSTGGTDWHVISTGATNSEGAGRLVIGTPTVRAVTIDGAGNLGLGTASPSALLDVNGTTRLRGLTTAGIVTTDASGNLSSATAVSLDATTASNGLTKTGTDIALGGTLSSPTTIGTTAANTLTVNGAGAVSVGTGTGATNLGNTAGATTIRGSGIALSGTVTSANALTVSSGNLTVSTGNATIAGTLNAGGANITGTTSINVTTSATTNIGNSSSNLFLRGSDVTVTGITSINASGTAATTIGTSPGAGTVTIGRSGGTVTMGNLTGTGTRVVTADAGGNLSTVALPTDAQTLSVGSGNLTISGGNSVTLASLGDNLGSHTATQALNLGSNALVGNSGTSGITISSAGAVSVAGGLGFPGNFGPDATYVGVTGNSISFGHTGTSEDFIGYKNNTFYLKDSPGGGDTADPNLVVGGSVTIGNNGTALAAVIKATVAKDLPNIGSNSTSTQTFAVANAAVGATVMVSPANALTDGMVMQYARVSAAGTVEVKFYNRSNGNIDEANQNFYITVIQ